mmetsp:Transcript_22264/g.44661  ORF Transcript_22264/g.44661 Transcript_22264/m.44661 type:complete len:599 (+) Transcript_22264:37-1833(+)
MYTALLAAALLGICMPPAAAVWHGNIGDLYKERKSGAYPENFRNCSVLGDTEVSGIDVVVTTFERDLCSVKLQARSLAQRLNKTEFGTIHYLWVSEYPMDQYKQSIQDIKKELNGFHFEFHEVKSWVGSGSGITTPGIPGSTISSSIKKTDTDLLSMTDKEDGWKAQQVARLLASRIVTSNYYLILDSANFLVEPLRRTDFLDKCNRGLMFPRKTPGNLPLPHQTWMDNAQKFLGSFISEDIKLDIGMTPFLMHTQTVQNLLEYTSERKASISEALEGTTELALYTAFVLSAEDPNSGDQRERVYVSSPDAVTSNTFWNGEKNLQSVVDNKHYTKVFKHGERLCLDANCKFITFHRGVVTELIDIKGGKDFLKGFQAYLNEKLNITSISDACPCHLADGTPSDASEYFDTTKAPQSVLIIQAENRDKDYVHLSRQINQIYANRTEGVDYKYESDVIAEALDKYPGYWAKVKIMLEESKRSSHDFVVVMDSDAVVSKHNYRFDQLKVFEDPRVMMVASKHPACIGRYNTDVLNAGVVVVRNSEEGRKVLERWMAYYDDRASRQWQKNEHGVWGCEGCPWAGMFYEQGSDTNESDDDARM